MRKNKSNNLSWVNRLHAFHKLLISLVIGMIVYFFVRNEYDRIIEVIMGWDTFCLVLLGLMWASYFTISSQQIREQSKKQDETRIVIFLIVLLSSIASLAAVVDIFISRSPFILIGISGMLLSWFLVHTIFASRYAHLYYSNAKDDPGIHAGGLSFPEDKKPEYLDFAYFSFVIGMTFQVSDVEVSSKRFRRLVLIHGLVSFCFNTFIVALTINVIGSMMQK
ncbi:MAG: DUF1345 domain-containing protein [Ferruginibacter sp.]